jgi:hypothetical protein
MKKKNFNVVKEEKEEIRKKSECNWSTNTQKNNIVFGIEILMNLKVP